MSSITFTQYLRPNGKRLEVKINRPQDVVDKAHDLALKGFKFEIEELMNGMISMTVEHPKEDSPIAHKICANNENVPKTVDELINSAYDLVK